MHQPIYNALFFAIPLSLVPSRTCQNVSWPSTGDLPIVGILYNSGSQQMIQQTLKCAVDNLKNDGIVPRNIEFKLNLKFGLHLVICMTCLIFYSFAYGLAKDDVTAWNGTISLAVHSQAHAFIGPGLSSGDMSVHIIIVIHMKANNF